MSGWGDATAVLERHGVVEDPAYYREFTAPDQKAVLTIAQRIQDAWARNDADRFADVFAPEGSLALGENELFGREAVRDFMRTGFAGPLAGASVAGGPLTCDLVTDDVAVSVTEGGIVMPGESAVAPERRIRATWVVRRRAPGELELLSHHSCPAVR
ncbi:SgcJ/EcaC family oxidoreductase [Actinomycetospora aeridis]|uniref:SgcJ/EcaC family oxidoreductase n=1 Tax=Actinomycetospora aeridis TaxID=3129231 RepID=A0ABU8N098_9PSEU